MNFRNLEKAFLPLKILVFFLMTWLIVDRIFLSGNFKNEFTFFKTSFQGNNSILLMVTIFLMPVNWLIETIKWKYLTKTDTSLSDLLKSVLTGITLGFVTPARSGEFIGRVMYLKSEHKTSVFYLSTIGGIAQTLVTLLAGVYFVWEWKNNSFLFGLSLGVAVSFLFLYFRFDLLNTLLRSNSFLKKQALTMANQELPTTGTLFTVLCLSALRYGVYLIQYTLIMQYFGVSENMFALFVHSGVFLVTQTFSPLMPILDISYRGGVAIIVFENISSNPIAVLSSVSFIWILNLVLPALLGYFFILRKKFN